MKHLSSKLFVAASTFLATALLVNIGAVVSATPASRQGQTRDVSAATQKKLVRDGTPLTSRVSPLDRIVVVEGGIDPPLSVGSAPGKLLDAKLSHGQSVVVIDVAGARSRFSLLEDWIQTDYRGVVSEVLISSKDDPFTVGLTVGWSEEGGEVQQGNTTFRALVRWRRSPVVRGRCVFFGHFRDFSERRLDGPPQYGVQADGRLEALSLNLPPDEIARQSLDELRTNVKNWTLAPRIGK